MKIFLALAAAVAAHASSSAPDWVNGSSAQYPREAYMTGVGSGDDAATARDRARGEIARVFSTLVTVNTSVSESEQNKTEAGKTASTFSQVVGNSVQTASQKVLEGTEVAETWQDKATSRYYALAVLEREKGVASLKDRIGDFDKQAWQWKEQMDKAAGRLLRVKAAMKLMALFKAREDLNSEFRVLDASGKGLPSPINEAIVRPEASQALSSLEVFVDMKGDSSDEIETGIVKGLNSFGLEAKSAGESAGDIIVEGKVSTEKLPGDGNAWRWARSTVTVSLKDGKTGKTFLRFDASERQAAAGEREAARRSHVKLAKNIAPKISEAIAGYFENQ